MDEMGAALLGFPDKTMANCMFGIQGKSEDSAHLYGDAGMIYLPQFWNCHEAKLYNAGEELLETVTDSQENGFIYEIEAFRDAFYGETGKWRPSPISSRWRAPNCLRKYERRT